MASLDLGDIVLSLTAKVKGHRRFLTHIHLGVPRETTPDDRVVNMSTLSQCVTPRGVNVVDLGADKKVSVALGFTDELENPVPAPPGAVTVFTVSDPTVLALTDNGDGTGEVAAVGALGSSNLHSSTTVDGGPEITGDEMINVVAGDAERVALIFGEPTEVTPDV